MIRDHQHIALHLAIYLDELRDQIAYQEGHELAIVVRDPDERLVEGLRRADFQAAPWSRWVYRPDPSIQIVVRPPDPTGEDFVLQEIDSTTLHNERARRIIRVARRMA